MSSNITDPIALLPYQTGLIVTPLQEAAAVGQTPLDTRQRSIVVGEPVPIVFGRRIDSIGGVFVSPGATEGRYANHATTNELTVKLQLVLSEGDLPQQQIRDLFQRGCRVGSWQQSYNARTGNWLPGNLTTIVAGTTPWDCPAFCGTGGSYANVTTLSYTNTHPDGDDTWDKQVHCFVREGMEVTRILDGIVGSSNNLIDLALYLIRQSSRFPEAMLDLAEMENAAEFLDTNGLYYNGIFDQSTNLEEWMEQISTQFLLRITDKNGKKAFRPRLPVAAGGAISSAAVSWVYTFTEEHILPDGFEIEYIPLAERKPICAQMIWRQQPDDDIGIVRTTEVRIAGEALNGPFEQYDLSQFCTSELHAVKVGAYFAARRRYIRHNLRLRVRPAAFNSTLALGDIVRVLLRRETDVDAISMHDYLYEVERINRNIEGVVELDLTHFPVNSSGQSILALIVNGATAPGYTIPTGRGTFTCDIPGRANDATPIGSDPYVDPNLPDPDDLEYNVPNAPEVTPPGATPDPLTESSPNPLDGPSNPSNPNNNPSDPLEESNPVGPTLTGNPTNVGSNLTANNVCPGAYIEWYRCPTGDNSNASTVTDQCTLVTGNVEELNYTISSQDGGYHIVAIGKCPDPSSPSGYGESFVIGTLNGGDSWTPVPIPRRLFVTGNVVTDITPQVNCFTGDVTPASSSTQAVYVGPYLGRYIVQYRIAYINTPVKAIVCGTNEPYSFAIEVQYEYAPSPGVPAGTFDGQGLFVGMVQPYPFNSNSAYTLTYTLEDLDIDLVP